MLRRSLTVVLRKAGYDVTAVGSAEEADEAMGISQPDLVMLDWMLPAQGGVSLLRTWRAQGLKCPVILLTARDAVEDRVIGLEAGANDYLCKPFAMEELLARVQVQVRDRITPVRNLALEACTVDLARHQVQRGEDTIKLSTKEAALLAHLAEHKGRAVERSELLQKVWGCSASVVTRTIDNTVLRLRSKIETDPASPKHVITVHGIGYRFEP